MGLDESLKLLVIAHEEGRHELARTPSVNVCSGNRRSDGFSVASPGPWEFSENYSCVRNLTDFHSFLWASLCFTL